MYRKMHSTKTFGMVKHETGISTQITNTIKEHNEKS